MEKCMSGPRRNSMYMGSCSDFSRADFTGCGKTKNSVILSEAKNLSLLHFLYLNRREILRFAQNDRTRPFFRSLFSPWVLVLTRTNPGRLKPAPLEFFRITNARWDTIAISEDPGPNA